MKRLDEAKSRLTQDGAEIATAFLADLLTAADAARLVDDVFVVTGDPTIRDQCAARGVPTIDERSRSGLNAAIATGVAAIGPARSIAVVTADLPCMTADALDELLAGAPMDRCAFVCDAQGVGTTTVLMPAHARIATAFGAHSRAAHRAMGCVELTGSTPAWPRLRRDVDTEVDLWDAVRIGVGPATSRAVRGWRT